jgi:uncharacterized protein (DUF302 family)
MHAIEIDVSLPIAEAEVVTREALQSEGFGVLTEIDVAATLKEKIGVERRPMKILGACNPGLSHRALEIEPSAALLLPCNVVLEEDPPGRTKVSIVDPRELMGSDELAEIATDATGRLTAAAARIGASG